MTLQKERRSNSFEVSPKSDEYSSSEFSGPIAEFVILSSEQTELTQPDGIFFFPNSDGKLAPAPALAANEFSVVDPLEPGEELTDRTAIVTGYSENSCDGGNTQYAVTRECFIFGGNSIQASAKHVQPSMLNRLHRLSLLMHLSFSLCVHRGMSSMVRAVASIPQRGRAQLRVAALASRSRPGLLPTAKWRWICSTMPNLDHMMRGLVPWGESKRQLERPWDPISPCSRNYSQRRANWKSGRTITIRSKNLLGEQRQR